MLIHEVPSYHFDAFQNTYECNDFVPCIFIRKEKFTPHGEVQVLVKEIDPSNILNDAKNILGSYAYVPVSLFETYLILPCI